MGLSAYESVGKVAKPPSFTVWTPSVTKARFGLV